MKKLLIVLVVCFCSNISYGNVVTLEQFDKEYDASVHKIERNLRMLGCDPTRSIAVQSHTVIINAHQKLQQEDIQKLQINKFFKKYGSFVGLILIVVFAIIFVSVVLNKAKKRA